MVGDALLERTAAEVAAGQRTIAGSMKQLVSQSGCPAAERLDYADDAVFLEPSLFAFFSPRETRVSLDQVLYGHLRECDRPAETTAATGRDGVVHLPGLGHVETGLPGRIVTLIRSTEPAGFAIEVDEQRVPHTMGPTEHVAGTHVEVGRYNDPLTDALTKAMAIEEPLPAHARDLARAFDMMHEAAPPLHEILLRVTRRVVVFRDARSRSFASFSAHGTAFLRASPEANELSFLEDLAHQCGHIAFNAMTLRKGDFLVDPERPLRSLHGNTKGNTNGDANGDALDERTAYEAFHGVFTECLMSTCLERCRELSDLSGARRHELLGRLSFIMKRLGLDLANLADLEAAGLFRDRGRELHLEFRRVFDEVFGRAAEAITGFDLRNQPYEYSHRDFVGRNPLASSRG